MASQPIVVSWEPDFVISVPVGAVALEQGDLLSLESNAAVLFDAVAEDATFLGISGGKCGTSDAGTYIDVYQKCIIEITLTSATYALGDAVKYTSKNTLVADADANTIGWIIDFNTATRTKGKVLIDVPRLGTVADKLFEKVSA